jgi:Patatin-like phospholipase
MTSDRRIGVALSGGGHRATVFGLGALQALTDMGLNDRIVSVSSVSGGSIANGIAMAGPDFGTADSADFERHISPALKSIATRGVLLGSAPRTAGYVRMLIGSAVLTVVGLIAMLVLAIAHAWMTLAAVSLATVVVAAVAWRLFRARSTRTAAAVDLEALGGRNLTLAEVEQRHLSVHHVICTTELQTGVSFYFTNRGVYGYGVGGATTAPTLPLATAVQASACVPGAFAPRVLKTSSLGLTSNMERVVLVDGGVYDNMADEWEYGYASRMRTWPNLDLMQPERASMLVVVNGSGGWNDTQPVGAGSFALEKAGLLRSQGVQYDVSTSHRRRALYDDFTDDDDRMKGVFAQITESPYELPKKFAAKGGDERAARAEQAIAALNAAGYTEVAWERVVADTSGTATTLAKLGVDRTVQLFEHGYVLTAVNLFVLHGLGSLPSIDRGRFQRMVVG